jgi:two-component system, chemotaxis family, protein-glutamate methylesterase/glutaminase
MSDKRVLIVDDDESIRELFECIVEDLGYQCDTAGDGEEGVAKVQAQDYSLVFLDIKMPKMNGIDTLKKIKELKESTIVTMMTGFSVDDLVEEALGLKAADVLYKPFDVDTLEEVITKWMN